MSGERQFLLYGEDADPGPSLAFDRGITGQDNVVSDRFISRAIACISTSFKPRPSVKTASGLPSSAREVNTSNWMKGRRREERGMRIGFMNESKEAAKFSLGQPPSAVRRTHLDSCSRLVGQSV